VLKLTFFRKLVLARKSFRGDHEEYEYVKVQDPHHCVGVTVGGHPDGYHRPCPGPGHVEYAGDGQRKGETKSGITKKEKDHTEEGDYEETRHEQHARDENVRNEAAPDPSAKVSFKKERSASPTDVRS
jgi:hypothetical protein